MLKERLHLLGELYSYKRCDLEVDDAMLKHMADLCTELALNPRVDSMSQRDALQLTKEVAELQGPPEYYRWREQRPEQARALRIRMAYLLTRELQFLFEPKA
jgi:hypothetical protein